MPFVAEKDGVWDMWDVVCSRVWDVGCGVWCGVWGVGGVWGVECRWGVGCRWGVAQLPCMLILLW